MRVIICTSEQRELLIRMWKDYQFVNDTLSDRYKEILKGLAETAEISVASVVIEHGSETHKIIKQIRNWYVELLWCRHNPEKDLPF